MEKILIVLKSYEHINFFLRMKSAMLKLNYNIIFITFSYATYRKLRKMNENVHLIKKEKNSVNIDIDIKKTYEFKIKYFSENLIKNLYSASYINIKNLVDKENVKYIFIWNGSEIIDKAAKKIAEEYNIKTIYFEIGNFPGKLFVDPFGTNAASNLYKNKNILKNYNVDYKIYQQWKEKFIERNLKQHIVKQSKNIFPKMGQFFWNRIGEIFITKFFCLKDTEEKILRFLYHKIYRVNYTSYDLSKKYIFFPLQVSIDTQIVIHSDINLQDALDYAIQKADELGYDLLVKPHPAEPNIKFMKSLLKDKKLCLVNYNTLELIKNAYEIITINSTVGLEARLLNKKVDILGKALYKSFNEEDISRYILGYLINIDYFSKEIIELDELKNILNRADYDNEC